MVYGNHPNEYANTRMCDLQLMLKQFPGYRNKFTPDAACKTIVPDEFGVLLSQRRRWINSTVHNLWELMLVPHLCGCLCFGMRYDLRNDI